MDCDFIETKFYYSHLRCQGEKESDDLRWLTSLWMSYLDPKVLVGNATELSFQAAQPTSLVPPLENMSQSALAFNATLYTTKIPETVKEALESDHWQKAMEEKINALQKNGTWEKCILPSRKKVVGCK